MTPTRPHIAYAAALRAFAATATVLAVGWLLTRAIVPEGRLETTTTFDGPAPFVSEPKPSERLAADGASAYKAVTGTPIYLDLTPPSFFETVRLTLRYRAAAPIVRLLALASPVDRQFTARTIKHDLLDALKWKRITQGDLTLWQRTPTYATVASFWADPPPAARVGAWDVEPATNFAITGYAPSAVAHDLHVSLRGSHRLLTYVKNEPLSFTFVVQDMNREAGPDAVRAEAFAVGSDDGLAAAALEDDGDAGDDQKSSALRELTLTVPNPRAGAYRLAFSASDDVFIREIRTKQTRVVFEDHVFLGDHVGYSPDTAPVTVYASGHGVTAQTPHAESTQTLTVDGAPLRLDQPAVAGFASFARDGRGGSGLAAIVSPKRDVELEADGLFALSRDAWFDPLPYSLGAAVTMDDLDARGVDYVVARYSASAPGVGAADFATVGLGRTDAGAFRFAVDALTARPGEPAGLSVAEATFSLTRRFGSLWAHHGLPLDASDSRPLQHAVQFGDHVE